MSNDLNTLQVPQNPAVQVRAASAKGNRFAAAMRVASPAAIALLAFAAGSAHAGLDSITENVTDVQDVVVACGALISVIGVCLCGYKIVFEGATFRDVSAKLLGCAIIGGAAAIAASFS